MGWAVGYDTTWQRWVGYGVPSLCDYPSCGAVIHRGLDYVCGSEPMGGEHGCGLYFCDKHLGLAIPYDDDDDDTGDDARILCPRCAVGEPPFDPTPDRDEWLRHMRTHGSWSQWRKDHPAAAREIVSELARRRVAKLAEKSRREWAIKT